MPQTVSTRLAADLREVLKRESFIYAGSADPANDMLPVPRWLVETCAEMLEISDKRGGELLKISKAFAEAMSDVFAVASLPEPQRSRVRDTIEKIRRLELT